MNAEQKQRAADLLSAWRATAYALHGDRMADLLQELVDAPEVLAATNPSQISSSAEPVMCPGCEGLPVNSNNPCAVCGKKAPAPRVPDGWRPFLTDVITAAGLLEHGKRDKGLAGRIGKFAFDAMRATPTPAEPPADVARDTKLLDWLDAQNKRFRMEWQVRRAPAGNVSINTVIVLGTREISTFRNAVEAAMCLREQAIDARGEKGQS